MIAGIAAATTIAVLMLVTELVVDALAAAASALWPQSAALAWLPSRTERAGARRILQWLAVVGLAALLAVRL